MTDTPPAAELERVKRCRHMILWDEHRNGKVSVSSKVGWIYFSGTFKSADDAYAFVAVQLRPVFASLAPVLFEEAAKVMEEYAAKLDRFAVTTEQRVIAEPEREKYSLTYAQADKNMAVEFRDLALTLRETIRRLAAKEGEK